MSKLNDSLCDVVFVAVESGLLYQRLHQNCVHQSDRITVRAFLPSTPDWSTRDSDDFEIGRGWRRANDGGVLW